MTDRLRLGLLTVLFGCASHTAGQPGDRVLTAVDTLIPESNDLLARPAAVSVDSAGLLYITDAKTSTIVVLDPKTRQGRTIGRAGGGPGEFSSPSGTRAFGDTLLVVDAGNNRLQALTLAGEYLGTRPLPPGSLYGSSLGWNGRMLVALNAKGGRLAQRFDAAGNAGTSFGTAPVPRAESEDFTADKQNIADGKVPAWYRNLVLPLLLADDGVWLIFQGEGRLERYDASDSLTWSGELDRSARDVILAEFFEQNRQEPRPDRLYSLAYAVAAREVGDAVWILLRMPEARETVIEVHDRLGPSRERLVIPEAHGIRGFAVSPDTKSLYLLAYSDATLLRADLPAGVIR
jgi:hypothetical protein